MKHLIWILLLAVLPARAQVFVYPVTFNQEAASGEADLWACWDLDEASGSRSDESGNSQTLTDNNTVTQRTGHIDDAAEFDDANTEYLSRADGAFNDFSQGNWSIAAWVYPDDLAPATQIVAAKYGTVLADDEFQLYIADWGGGYIWVGDGDTQTASKNVSGFTAATWHLIVATWDDGADSLCVSRDGAAKSCATVTWSIASTTTPFNIGSRNDGDVLWDGSIDAVRLYGKTLDDTDISNLYNSGTGRDCSYTLP